jgi:hypothetical protein
LALQQPPLQAVWLAPRQPVPHLCAFVSQACPALPPAAGAQSVCESHPHTSVPGSHFEPFAFPTQFTHVPEPPHVAGWFPATHALPAQQKPPPHVPSVAAPQADVHAPAVHVGVPFVHGEHA